MIVPNYNHARFLRQRLDSVYGQTYRDFEVILLDDASTDDSLEILAEYAARPRTRFVANRRNGGCAFKQWNKGVRLARGQYVWIAEADDWAEPTFLEQLVGKLDGDPRLGVVYCQSWYVDHLGERIGLCESWYDRFDDPARWKKDYTANGRSDGQRHMVRGNVILTASAAVFRREVYWAAGGADERYQMAGDWATWFRILLRCDYAFVAQPLNYWRRHDGTVRNRTTKQLAGVKESYSVVKMIRKSVSVDEEVADGALCDLYNEMRARLLGGGKSVSRWQLLTTLGWAWKTDPGLFFRLQKYPNEIKSRSPFLYRLFYLLAGGRMALSRSMGIFKK